MSRWLQPSRVAAASILLLLALAIAGTFGNAARSGQSFPKYNRYYSLSDYVQEVESFFSHNFVLGDSLRGLAIGIKQLGGQQEFGQVYVGKDILVEDIGWPDQQQTDLNRQALETFLDRSPLPVSFLLLPTKCAIKQNEIDPAAPLFNQKQFIEQTYSQVVGKATVVDVYPVLFSNMDQYIYYRTDPGLTSLGAYYVYDVLAQRLGITRTRSQEEFSLQQVTANYTGRTYEAFPYAQVTPDVLTLYHYQKSGLNYTVTHNEDYSFTYSSLYPTHLKELDQVEQVLLGGNTGDLTIRSNMKTDNNLLIIGDSSILPVIPFLMTHYAEIRFVDLSQWREQEISQLELEDYQRVLLTYSVDTFIHQDGPQRLEHLVEQ